MPTVTKKPQVKVNKMTKEQYDAATKVNGEFYVVTDDPVVVWGEIGGDIEDQEDLVEYIDENGGKIDTIKVNGVEQTITDKTVDIAVPEVINDVAHTDTDKSLSANMGKELNDRIDSIKARGRFLSTWDCSTGLAGTTPTTLPYTYNTGDYFIVSVVGESNNKKPSGNSYTGAASEEAETGSVSVNDTYLYDGTNWTLLHGADRTVSFSAIAGQPSDNTNLAAALNAKVTANADITGATKTKITYDSKGLVTAGADLEASDIPNLTLSKITDVTATASEVNVLDGITATTTELNYVDGVTSSIQTQLNSKQGTLTAGDNITIASDVISAKDTTYAAGTNIEIVSSVSPIAGYTLLSYINCDGSHYIDTGVAYASNSVITMMVKGSENYPTAEDGFLAGSYPASGNSSAVAFIASGNKLVGGQLAGSAYSYSSSAEMEEVQIDLAQGKIFFNDEQVVSRAVTPEDTVAYIFAVNKNGTAFRYGKANIRSYTQYNGTTKVLELVAAKRNSDNALGLYDKVTNTFKTCEGLSAGPVLEPPFTINCTAEGQTYTAGTGLDLNDNEFSVDYDETQAKLSAGTGIIISEDNEISVDSTIAGNRLAQGTGTVLKKDLPYIYSNNGQYANQSYGGMNGWDNRIVFKLEEIPTGTGAIAGGIFGHTTQHGVALYVAEVGGVKKFIFKNGTDATHQAVDCGVADTNWHTLIQTLDCLYFDGIEITKFGSSGSDGGFALNAVYDGTNYITSKVKIESYVRNTAFQKYTYLPVQRSSDNKVGYYCKESRSYLFAVDPDNPYTTDYTGEYAINVDNDAVQEKLVAASTGGLVITESELPFGYEAVKEIYCPHGLDTGLAISNLSPTTNFVLSTNWRNTTGYYGYVFGARSTVGSDNYEVSLQVALNGGARKLVYRYANGGEVTINELQTYQSYENPPEQFMYTNTGATLITGGVRTYSNIGVGTTKCTIVIGGINNDGTISGNGSNVIQRTTITVDGKILFDAIPCVRISDKQAGFYDIIGNKFIYNSTDYAQADVERISNISVSKGEWEWKGTGTDSIELGNSASATTQYSLAVGYSALSKGQYSVAVGTNAEANIYGGSSGGVAIGGNAHGISTGSIAIGKFAVSSGGNAISIGAGIDNTTNYTQAIGANSVAIGTYAKASAAYAIQLSTGTNSTENTLQFRTYRLVDASGYIPAARLASGGSAGQALKKTDSGMEWGDVDGLPSQSGHSGEFLTTNGTIASWATVPTPTYNAETETIEF